MCLKIAGLIVVILCGLAGLFFRKLAPVVLRHEPDENEIIKFKTILLALVAVGALIIILPDYL